MKIDSDGVRRASWIILTCDEGSLDLACGELRKICPAEMAATLAPGVLLMRCGRAFAEVAAAWRQSPPIFVRHICPAQMTLPLTGGAGDVALLVEALGATLFNRADETAMQILSGPLPDFLVELAFSVQTRILTALSYKPFDVNNALAAVVQTHTGAPLDVRNPQQIISVIFARIPQSVLTPSQQESLFCFLGLSLAADNLSNWAGGMRRFAREEDQVSRAEFKLLEALEFFHIHLAPHGVALDLGAAPGGWTRVLRHAGQYVTAVDPGELDPRLADDNGVRHLRMTAEEYLRSDPDQFDVIVNDMRMDVRDSARLMVAFARFLYPQGIAIMTLKLPEEDRGPLIDEAFTILRRAYTISGARQLFHNRSEITLFLSAPRVVDSSRTSRGRRERGFAHQ